MKKQTFIVILLLACILFSVIQSSLALESLAKPNVTVPNNWMLDDETPYPDISGEHDPDGSGSLEYSNPDTAAFILMYYESALGVTYSYNELEDEAVVIFNRNSLEDFPFEDSGTMTVAGVPAGYVKGHDSEYDLYYMQLVFVKDVYYFDVRCVYQHQSQDESAVSSLINSISVGTGGGGGGEFPIVPLAITFVVIVVVVVVVLAVLLLRGGKKRPAFPKDGKSEVAKRDTLINIKTQSIEGRLSTGYTKLDTLLLGGIPPKFAVALTMPASDEGNQLIQKFLETGAKNNEITFYVTTDPTIDPGFATDLVRNFPSNFYLFVANPQTKILLEQTQTPNMFALNGIANLTEINIALTKAFRKIAPAQRNPRRICLNIISDVLLEHGSVLTRKWLSELIVSLSSKGFTILAVLYPQMHSSEDVHSILGLFDGEINISERETVKEFRRFLKIKRMSSQKYLKVEIDLSED